MIRSLTSGATVTSSFQSSVKICNVSSSGLLPTMFVTAAQSCGPVT